MPGIPSGEGSGHDRNSSWFSERFPPYPASFITFSHIYKDLLGEMLSDLSHLPFHERMDALGKKLKEHELSKAPSVHTNEDEDEEDDEEDEEDMERGRVKLIDDEQKPRRAEEHQVYSECERECKKPRLAECVEKPEGPRNK
ncbi:uncharacterized protein [Miscanthus floridulus]|uniref:uncharacterized protein n=1 Tax=Miscanthus floridulus TaxID=154761 RepID=UPI00345A0DE6